MKKLFDSLVEQLREATRFVGFFARWMILAFIVGAIAGLVGTGFYHSMNAVTRLRVDNPWLLYLLPVGGLFITWMYKISGRGNDRGTNMVLSAARDEDNVPVRITPLIFISTVISHLFGASVGREGAALQMGGSIGNGIARALRMNKEEINIMIMCGMSAGFAALFGTPMAAAIFAMEVVSVGIMYYAAIIPCVIAALVAKNVAHMFGVHAEAFHIVEIPIFALPAFGKTVLLAVLCAGVSVLFCKTLHSCARFMKDKIKNPYLRVVVASVIIIGINLLLGTTDYRGAGMDVIERAMDGQVRPEAFLLKMGLTALALGAGFRGGEIVPTLFVGSTFGCLVGQLLGISPSLCAAIGMAAVFCGVTNCPISTLLLSLELFGMDAMPYLLMAIAISYTLSGYGGLYNSQHIVFSKVRTDYHNSRKLQRKLEYESKK